MQQLLKNIVLIAGGMVMMYLAAVYITPYILPFVAAGFLAVLLEPAIRFFQRKVKFSRRRTPVQFTDFVGAIAGIYQ